MWTAKKVPSEAQERLLGTLVADYRSAEISDTDRAMLDYVSKLSGAPATIEKSDVESLRASGFDDHAVHDICSIASYFAFVNRIADGLGVELETSHDESIE